MLAGDVHYAVNILASYVPVIREGRIRALAIASAERWPTLPEVPTMAEAGIDGFEVTSWHLWAAPAGTPRPVINRLVETIRGLYVDPELEQRARHGRAAARLHPEGGRGAAGAGASGLGRDGPRLRREGGVARPPARNMRTGRWEGSLGREACPAGGAVTP
jgi:hypothetical protein